MTLSKITKTRWDSASRLIVTHISGDLGKEEIEAWEKSLTESLAQIEDNSTFKIFVNLYGFKALDIEAHKRFRTIIPLALADYGWKVGYLGLFEEEAKSMTIRNTRGIQCIGAAHSHQDETKMSLYETRFGHEKERFFTNPNEAMEWIQNLN